MCHKYHYICPKSQYIDIEKLINICIDTSIEIDIDIDNFNTDASTVNSVHACLIRGKKHFEKSKSHIKYMTN